MKELYKYLTILILLFTYGCSSESESREKLVQAFWENFGFKPPESIKEIKLKNLSLFDSQVHWMAFTFNAKALEAILVHDQPLEIAESNSVEFQNIVKELKEGANNPDWLIIPNEKTTKIYYKKHFLKHNFSEYFLWTDEQTAMTFLYVEFFD